MRGQCVGTKITLAANCRRAPVGDEIIIDCATNTVFRWGDLVRVSPSRFRILSAFAACPGRYLTAVDLADVMYFDDRNGGPDGPVNVIGAQVHRLRYEIASLGLVIASNRGWRKWLMILDHPASDAEVHAVILKSMVRKAIAA